MKQKDMKEMDDFTADDYKSDKFSPRTRHIEPSYVRTYVLRIGAKESTRFRITQDTLGEYLEQQIHQTLYNISNADSMSDIGVEVDDMK